MEMKTHFTRTSSQLDTYGLGQPYFFMRFRLCLALSLVGLVAQIGTGHAQISKGHQILINRGLQTQGNVANTDPFHLTTYSNANYSSINWLWTSTPAWMGTAPGFPWSRWVGDENQMPPQGSEGP